ncbi:hypothetical protein P5G51_018255 [Virgibacillus sp. 179-BFC.A HS]|uniref:Transporter n=1 Tax=Tigheibacillus jepli TaxID=3035914 RepID=A0ABU5CMK3_9BACI|nr:hypothetical protein [Virgibacillus sp. 179-BFC.A HS]MDY0407024.1 hypothetical protein [Virgibacillus sp. 179-BFC.A HS]
MNEMEPIYGTENEYNEYVPMTEERVFQNLPHPFSDMMNQIPGMANQQFGPPSTTPGQMYGPGGQHQGPFNWGLPYGGEGPGQGGGGFPGMPHGGGGHGQAGGGWFPGPPHNGGDHGQHGGGFPGDPTHQGPSHGGPPNSPPPSFEPQQPPMQTFAVDSGAIRMCRFRFTYIWLHRESFWFYPTFVGRNSIAGFRWHRNRWVYFGIDLNRIVSFQCF